MRSEPQRSLGLLRRMVVANLTKPLPELIHHCLQCVTESLDARAAFLSRLEEGWLEIVDAVSTAEPGIPKGLRLALEDTFDAAAEDGLPVNVRDASKRQPFKGLPMRRQLGIVSYLGVPVTTIEGQPYGTLAVLGKGSRVFSDEEVDLVLVMAGMIGLKLKGAAADAASGTVTRTPLSAVRLASHDVKEPLAIMRGYADMLSHNQVPPDQMPLVAKRLAMQSETVMRVVDQLLLMSHLPLELAFTVRVSMVAVAQAAADRFKERMTAAGMELRLQLDAQGEVWGDAALLEAALDEMLHNVFQHAPTATVVQVRLRQPAVDHLQLVVKDDGPGVSAERLGDLFGPLPASDDQPARGQGLGLYLLRRVAQAHGGRAWANSLEGKGTTFYLELPAASPDGDVARASASVARTPA